MFQIPPPEQVDACIRGVCSGAAAQARLSEAQACTVAAVAGDVFGHPVDVSAVEPVTPAELADAVDDPRLRHQLVVAMIALSLMVHPPDPEGPTRIAGFASRLGVDEPMLAATRRYVDGQRRWMLLDFARHSMFRPLLRREAEDRGIVAVARNLGTLAGVSEDRDLAERHRALEAYPAGSWGRVLWEFYEANGWPLPGEKGSVPQATAEHDWVHVLSGYPPTPLGEIQVAAYMAANATDDRTAFSVLFWAMGIYETAAVHLPVPSHVGTMSTAPDAGRQLADALRRGGACRADSLFMDHWAHARRPLVEVREELAVGPKRFPGPDPAPSVPTAIEPAG